MCVYVFISNLGLHMLFFTIGNEGTCGDKGTLAKQGMDEHNQKNSKNLWLQSLPFVKYGRLTTDEKQQGQAVARVRY